MSRGIVYANSCSTKVAGFICNKKCSVCSEEACFTQNGRCYMTFCRQKMVDWYAAAEYCENHFSGLATEITGNGTKGKRGCSEFWIGLTKERWKAGDSYMIHHGWLAGEEDRSHHCAFVSGRGKTNRKLSDCMSVRNAICLPRSIQTVDVVLEETSINNVSIFLGFGEESTVYNLSITQQIVSDGTIPRWLIGAASLCIPLALALFISIGVHLYRHCKRKGVHLLPVVRRRNNSIPCPRQALHSSVTFYGSSFVASTSNSLKSQESVCSMCDQSNEDNNLHYENMLMTEVTRCGACGRLVKPQRPVKPRPVLPKRAPESSMMALHKYSPVASLKWQDDYENMARGLKTIPVKELRVANLLLATEPTSSTQPRGLGSRRPKSIL